MTQAVTQGSTSTYAYDYAGNRVSQVVGSSTTIYPNKYYSITSTTNGATTYATTTVYVWNGDTLIDTIDQPMVNGAATGTPATRYIHPDHLGSTNIVTDESGNVVQDSEYYPYGETRLNQATYPTKESRQFIGQFKDGNSLAYLNARYLNSQQGQFLSEDPAFLGDPSQQVLTDPQSLNSYSYSDDNPVNKKDPSGRCLEDGCFVEAVAALGFAGGIATQAFHDYSTGDFSRRSVGQNIATYTAAGGAGAIVAAGTAIAGVETVGLGLLARVGATGLTSGALTAATDIGTNKLLGQPTDGGSVLTDSIVNGFGSGILTFLPGVPGALPQSIRSALTVFSKAHAARSGAEAFFGTSLQMLGSAGYQYGRSSGASSGGSGATQKSGGGSQRSNSQSSPTYGNSVSSWMGSFNPFSPH
jgi:RHS repeat-associated protein